jgi:hypothetical protein
MKHFKYACCLTLLVGVASAIAQQPKGNGSNADPAPAPVVQLTDEEQRLMQSSLEARASREREYQEAVLAAQAAQARFEAANNATAANFYKLCARYKLDPDRYELAPDGKNLRPKPKPAEQEKK